MGGSIAGSVEQSEAALAAQYGAAPTRGRCSWTLVTLMIRPPPWTIMRWTAR